MNSSLEATKRVSHESFHGLYVKPWTPPMGNIREFYNMLIVKDLKIVLAYAGVIILPSAAAIGAVYIAGQLAGK